MGTDRHHIKMNTLLYVCKTSPRHGWMHRRFQISLVIERYGKTWKSPMVKRLVMKYGAQEC